MLSRWGVVAGIVLMCGCVHGMGGSRGAVPTKGGAAAVAAANSAQQKAAHHQWNSSLWVLLGLGIVIILAVLLPPESPNDKS